MARKSVLAMLLVLCIAATIDASTRVSLGSGNLRSSGWFGKKRDFYFLVPTCAYRVSLDYRDRSSGGLSVGHGNGKATVSWRRRSRKAKVHAWVNGKAWGSNRVSWTVWAWLRH